MSKTDIRPSEPAAAGGDASSAAAARQFLIESGMKAHRPPRWWGVVTGLVAAGTGLAVGELVAGFSSELKSPVVTVGDRVIDWVPKWMKDFAVENFGTSDKVVLIWTILIVIAIAASLVGIATVRGRRQVGIIGAAIFGVLGAAAGGFGRNTTIVGAIPALFAAATAGGVLMVGYQMAHPRPVVTRQSVRSKTSVVPMIPPLDRRKFLIASGGLAVVAIGIGSFGKDLQHRFNSSLERAGVRLPVPKDPLPTPPADPALLPENQGLSPLIVPITNFYRIDTALSFPNISLSSWSLKIGGMVDRELKFSYDDLLARDLIERDITMSCVSNDVGGDLVGNARWVGCRLDDLLDEAGIQRGADQIMGVSDDDFTAGFPVNTLDGRDAMVVFGMNNEVLPVKNGFPARIVVPGLYGYVSAVKWLKEIRLTTFAEEQGYWIPRGWSALGPVKTQSRIDRPGTKISVGNTVIGGVAWAPSRGIEKVEVQVDDNEWVEAMLGPVLSEDTWVQWWTKWDATEGRHQIRVRATDGRGETQTEELARVDPDGATGWHTIRVTVSA
ncbi:MAG: molybdopterin-dependent oxidoreductase [Ilumatobacteraceae bacterium]